MNKICCIGINDMPRGWTKENEWNHRVHQKWISMIKRCYNEKCLKRNKTYKDCYVCERWLILSNFVEDFKLIDGYDEYKFLNGELALDKDIKSDNQNKCYCLEQCILLNKSENIKQAMKHRDYSDIQGKNHPLYGKHHSEETKKLMSDKKKGKNHPQVRKVVQYDLEENLIKMWDYIRRASKELNITESSISECCRGKRKTAGGFIWKYIEDISDEELIEFIFIKYFRGEIK